MNSTLDQQIINAQLKQHQRAADEAEIAHLPELLEKQRQQQQQAHKTANANAARELFNEREPAFLADLAENNRRIADLSAKLAGELGIRQQLRTSANNLHTYAAHIADERRAPGATGDAWDAGITWLKQRGQWPLMRDDGAAAALVEAVQAAISQGFIQLVK